jgi:hypothetical protein
MKDSCSHSSTAFSWVLDEYGNPLPEMVLYCENCKDNLEYIHLHLPLKGKIEQNYLACIYNINKVFDTK